MKIKRQIMNELEALTPSEILTVYSIVTAMKRGKRAMAIPVQPEQPAYLRVRRILCGTEESMGEEIVSAREDRV